MTTSATSTANITAQDLIDLALTDIGVIGQSGGVPDANLRDRALTVLQLLMKSLDNKGLMTWKVVRRVQILTAGQASYALSNDVSDIDKPARYTQLGATTGSQVDSMTRDEYMVKPDRTIQGISYQYYVEKSLDTTGIEFITLFLYPVPANTGDTLEYAAALRILDITNITQTLDVPQKWLNAIRWLLAHELTFSYKVPPDRLQMIQNKAKSEIDDAIGDDTEHADIQFVPWGDSVGYSYGSYGWGR